MVKTKILIFLFFIAGTFSLTAQTVNEKLRPADLDFSGLEKEIEEYLDKAGKGDREIAERRIGIVKNFKKMVLKILRKNPYEGPVYLKSSTVQGKITKADENEITVEVSGKSKAFKWDEVNSRLYADIFINAAVNKAERLNAENRTGSEKAFEQAGNYYYALAVFYDWYANPAAAKIFRKKALTLNPDLKKEIEKMWQEDSVLTKKASEL